MSGDNGTSPVPFGRDFGAKKKNSRSLFRDSGCMAGQIYAATAVTTSTCGATPCLAALRNFASNAFIMRSGSSAGYRMPAAVIASPTDTNSPRARSLGLIELWIIGFDLLLMDCAFNRRSAADVLPALARQVAAFS